MKELTVQANLDNIAPVTEFINAELEAANCCEDVRIQIDVAIDEIFGNIAKYAYDQESAAWESSSLKRPWMKYPMNTGTEATG